MKDIGFSKEVTNAVKGIALLLMLVLHFFCFPSWYVDGVDMGMDWMEKYQGHFQICVAIFAFLSGYMYFFAKEKTLKYSLKKIIDTIIPYWCVLVILLVVSFFTGDADLSVKTVALEFLTVEHAIIPFGWYVTFYILMMLIFPLVVYVFKEHFHIMAIVSLLCPMAGYFVSSKLGMPALVMGILEKFQVYFPIAAIGYWGASQGVFEKLDPLVSNKLMRYIVNICLIVIVFMEPSWLYGLPFNGTILLFIRKCVRIFSILLFMWSLISVLKMTNCRVVDTLAFVGKYSLMMWFVHSIFFNISENVFQPLLFFTANPFLVLIWGGILTLLVSIPLNRIEKHIRSFIQKKIL